VAVQFHHLRIDHVDRVTPDAIAITFDVPEQLRPVFQYKQGQYVTVRVTVDGVEHRRNYSLCSSPYADEPMTIAVKRVRDGAVSQYLNDHAAPGLAIEVYPPMGNFTKELDPSNARHYVLYAGGSGITPILSILKSILRIEPKSRITMFYANRDEASIIFADQLDAIAASYGGRFELHHMLEDNDGARRSSSIGRLDPETTARMLAEFVPDAMSAEYFICGPQGMMDAVISAVRGAGVDDHHIHREYFTISKPSNQSDAPMQSTDDAAERKTRTVTIRLYGQESTFEVEPDETILSAAQRADLDPPFACQIGACCTCRAKLLSGKVVMDEREALSDDEIADGYVLTCQSHPITDDVVADYDQ
jgi:ring-1,2-phenylacetyl-CoA epoxidase subunit PaaE